MKHLGHPFRIMATISAVPVSRPGDGMWWADAPYVRHALTLRGYRVSLRTVERDLMALTEAGIIKRRPCDSRAAFYGRTEAVVL